MRSDSYKGTRAALPFRLLPAYDQIADLLYGGERPNRRIRLDMCTACVESFDWMVRLIANSPFCVADLLPNGNERKALYGKCGQEKSGYCQVCIRSYAYRMMIEQKKAKEELK